MCHKHVSKSIAQGARCLLQVICPWTHLVDQAVDVPQAWAPVLAINVRQYSQYLPLSAFASWLQAISKQNFQHNTKSTTMLWMLRLVHELARAWPSATTFAEAADSIPSSLVNQQGACWQVCFPI